MPPAAMSEPAPRRPYWQPRELILVGAFAALTKLAGVVIALAGGGMNPLSLALKNTVATVLLVVLLLKAPKFGVLTLYVVSQSVFSLLLMGGSLMLLPGLLPAGILGDLLIRALGGYRRTWAVLVGVGVFDLLSKAIALGFSFLAFREDPRLFIMPAIFIGLGYLGSLLGLVGGLKFVKELRHAGLIRA
ncbi:MAG: MptD family putative ECF transporter S component [Pseudomonadota bacterium]